LPVVRQSLDDSRCNLIVGPSEGEIRVALIGHVDTVSAYDLEEYGFHVEDRHVRGLGTADMKGGCAAMVEAYTTLWDMGIHPPIALCLVVGEEEEGDGADRLVEDYHFPWAIIGEPTSLHPCLRHYGYLEVQLTTHGKRVHASLANTTQNPIEAMFRLMLRIAQFMERDTRGLTYNVRDLFSSPSGFAVPENCEAWLDIHVPPAAPIGEILTDLEEVVSAEDDASPGIVFAMRTATIDNGYDLPPRGLVVEVLQNVYEDRSILWKPGSFRSHSDANKLWAAGIKTILLGPGQLEMAHTPEESISLDEVIAASQIYVDFMLALKKRL
jgi:acetylornithine deacetylase